MAKKTHPKVEAIAHRIMSEYLLHPDPKINSWITFDKALKLAQSAFVLVQFEPDSLFIDPPIQSIVLKFTKRKDATDFVELMNGGCPRRFSNIRSGFIAQYSVNGYHLTLSVKDAPVFGDVHVCSSLHEALSKIDVNVIQNKLFPKKDNHDDVLEALHEFFWKNGQSSFFMNASETKIIQQADFEENERNTREFGEFEDHDEWLERKQQEEEDQREWEEFQINQQQENEEARLEWEAEQERIRNENQDVIAEEEFFERSIAKQKTELESFMKGIA